MTKKQLIATWVIGILISLAFLIVDVKIQVARPIIVKSDNPDNLNLDSLVRDNLPPIKLPTTPDSKQGLLRIMPPILIIGCLLIYTLREKK